MMLGWNISVYRLERGAVRATTKSPTGVRLAAWQTGLDGLDWIDELVKEGKAKNLGGNGYPCRFTATAEHLIPHFVNGSPEAQSTLSFEGSGILMEGWKNKTATDQTAIAACPPDEWLLLVAWDERRRF
jgi:hypothetical protein